VDASLIARLRADLSAADFTVDALTALWGEDAAAALHRGQRVPAIRALTDVTPLATLAKVFVLGLPSADLDAALPTLTLTGAVELGLATPEGVPLLDLRPYSVVDGRGVVSWWIASDLGELALGHAIPEHHVLGVGGASTTLSGLMIAATVDRALDLGTGCGIQALHAARYATHVVATDISQRALDLAQLNAALNAVDNIEFRLGSLFDPVAGESFGHIVSNPPFVITPRGSAGEPSGIPEYEYRDGGMVGDGIVEAVVRGVEAILEPGGIAQLLGNWEYGDRDGLERVAGWVAETGLDAWVVEREVQSVELYAETWIRDGGTRPGAEFDRLYTAWLDDFAARGVTHVGFGYVTLRRPVDGAATLRRFEHYGEPLGGSLGDHIAAVFAAHDWLAGRDDAALSLESLTIAPDVTEHRHYWPGEEHPTVMLLRQGAGFARTVPVGTLIAAVIGACDGTLSLGAICAAVAQLLEVDEGALAAEVLPQVRELVVAGLLT
jgi:methylase of polypeptide subunit release factors